MQFGLYVIPYAHPHPCLIDTNTSNAAQRRIFFRRNRLNFKFQGLGSHIGDFLARWEHVGENFLARRASAPSLNTRVQLLLVLLYYYYYSIILQIYNSFNHSSRWTLAYSSTTGIPFTNGWFNKTEYHPSNGAAPKEETQKHECEAGSKFSHLDWSVK